MPQENHRREENLIYTRNYGKTDRGVRYNPPPGYDGNAFSGQPEVKMHRAQEEIFRPPQNVQDDLPQPEYPEPESMEPEEIPEIAEEEERKPEPAEVRAKPVKEEEASKFPEEVPAFAGGIQSLEALFRHLRGRFGREELIIVLVMLLVSSDGASPEILLLALLLLAG